MRTLNSIFAVTIFAVFVFAQPVEATNISDDVEKTTITEKADRPVSLNDLPTPVQRALAGEDFRGWTAREAHQARKDDGTEYYKIKVMKERGESKTVRIAADGTIMDRKRK